MIHFKIAQRSPIFWGNFCKLICYHELQKNAQSGHSVSPLLSRIYIQLFAFTMLFPFQHVHRMLCVQASFQWSPHYYNILFLNTFVHEKAVSRNNHSVMYKICTSSYPHERKLFYYYLLLLLEHLGCYWHDNGT